MYGDVPYIDGAELDAWNKKRIEAHEMLEEWETQGIDMEMISDNVGGTKGEYFEKGYHILIATGDFVVESVAEAAVGGMILDKAGDIYKVATEVSEVIENIDSYSEAVKK